MTDLDWLINIEDASERAAAMYGQAVVDDVFRRHGAHGVDDLASCYYSDVFAELDRIAND